MEIDKITLSDLAIFNSEEEFSVFNKLNATLTSRGKEQMIHNLATPLRSVEAIHGIQQTLKEILSKEAQWPKQISNGTLMVVERFYETMLDQIPANPNSFAAYSYKLLHAPDFSLVRYSITHCFDFIKGMEQMLQVFLHEETPAPMKKLLLQAQKDLVKEPLKILSGLTKITELPMPQMLAFAHFARYRFKQEMLSLIYIYAKLDAWYGMAMAVKKLGLSFPEFIATEKPLIEATGLYHILVNEPVAYDVSLDEKNNFLFLTGANMAGKSTFIKSVGTAVFLAHTGMGVPAAKMSLCYFDGMLSNINVIDNIARGESYFFNEVQRIKATINKVNDGRKWLILIDELFKGTNVQDAMKCSLAVIEGLLKIEDSIFILSTHLYEIGEGLKKYPNISFNYFETFVEDDQLSFNYQLRPGISNDRLGYLILKKEGVVKMLEDL
ncbi:MAG: MutS-related protein family 1 [Ferruginibacter sp.]|nr:MutS-related protein family 1 [Ferruginibacter sp.]